MKKILYILFGLIAISACKKKYDVPPITPLSAGETIALDSLINMFAGNPIKFDTDLSLYATVTMDESDGNLYKNVYIHAIVIRWWFICGRFN